MASENFDTCFDKAFADGLADVRFFVRRGNAVSTDELKAEALAFQEAINEKNFTSVEAVD